MGKVTMFEMSASAMDRHIAAKSGALQVMVAPKGMSFKVEVEFDSKVEKSVAKDPLVMQEMSDAIKAVYEDLVARIGDNLQKTDRGAVQLRDSNQLDKLKKLVEVVGRGIEGARDIAVERAEKDVQQVWKNLARTRAEYTKYKIKIVTKISLAAAGLITSIALFATGAVSFGASSIPAVVGMVKSVLTMSSEIVSAAQEIEDTQKRLEGKLKLIEERFVSAKGQFTKAGMAQEAGMALAAQFLGTSGPLAVMPSIKDAIAELGTVKSKYGGIVVKSHDLAKTLNKVLEKMDAAKTEFLKDVTKQLDKHPSPLAKRQPKEIEARLDAELAPFIGKVQDALQAVLATQARLKTAEPELKAAEARVMKLAKLKGTGWKIFDNVLVLSDLALSFVDPSAYEKTAELAAGIGQAAGSLVADKISKKVLEGSFLE
jgi:DNA repair exonuclease SbcCD ATPase subunit